MQVRGFPVNVSSVNYLIIYRHCYNVSLCFSVSCMQGTFFLTAASNKECIVGIINFQNTKQR